MALQIKPSWVVVLVLAVGICYASDFTTLRLTVHDRSGSAVAGAKVTITTASRDLGYPKRSFRTDNHGHAESILSPGRYWIEVDQAGFQPGAAVVDLEEGRILEKLVELGPAESKEPPNPFRGPHEGQLFGTLYDASRAVIPAATIEITSNASQATTKSYEIHPDAGGSYHANLAVGRYMVTVKANGFLTRVLNVEIEEGRAANLDFTLEVNPLPTGPVVQPDLIPAATSPIPDRIEPKQP